MIIFWASEINTLLPNIIGIVLGIATLLFGVYCAIKEAETDEGKFGFCAGGLVLGFFVWVAWPIFLGFGLIALIVYGVYKGMEFVVNYKPKAKFIKEISVNPNKDKYKTMLSEALDAIEKYHINLSKTKLTPEGKAIIASVGASIESVSKIVQNAKEKSITVDVFEKAYQAIKANRIELQRAEKLVSIGIEDQLEQEIKLMKATLPR